MVTIGQKLKEYAREIGFDAVGITTAEPFPVAQRSAEGAMDRGFVECFPWFTRERLARGCSPSRLVESAASVISLGAAYAHFSDFDDEENAQGSPLGRVSRYALAGDYHEAMHSAIGSLAKFVEREAGAPVDDLAYVDTGPLLERAVGQRAGIGWFGKNTNLLVPGIGSWVFLGELITSLEIEPDAPLRKSCGSCEACATSCPTGALLAPYALDARRCISFLTIELKGWMPRELRPTIGRWVFGCDVCQEVCPVNVRARSVPSPILTRMSTVSANPSLVWLLNISEGEYRAGLRRSALHRARRRGLRRNAAVALGNSGDRSAVPHLARVLVEDEDDLVRGHVAWALGRLGGVAARAALEKALQKETVTEARAEIEYALEDL